MKQVIEQALGKFLPYVEWQQQHLGRQAMMIAVLRWLNDNPDTMTAESMHSLLAAMQAALTTHYASQPEHPIKEAA